MPPAADADNRLFHLCLHRAWQAAQKSGAYDGGRGPDPFIHLSTAEQVAESAALHFTGVADLVLLTVDGAALGPELRWEASRGGGRFPHLYGDLPLDAVVAVDRLPLDAEGRHIFPDGVTGTAST
ncbi:MAG: DUF952 domain-containing protein [Alphaproteobacteria bacterium]|nr:DUF952 domain-containing protein [Alphaproteobacteria bacterium]